MNRNLLGLAAITLSAASIGLYAGTREFSNVSAAEFFATGCPNKEVSTNIRVSGTVSDVDCTVTLVDGATALRFRNANDIEVSGALTIRVDEGNSAPVQVKFKDSTVTGAGTLSVEATKVKVKDSMLVQEGSLELTASSDEVAPQHLDDDPGLEIRNSMLEAGGVPVRLEAPGPDAEVTLRKPS
jgi:type 1 fimbria pilin